MTAKRALFVLLVACGSARARPTGVSGSVTVAGKPVAAADVVIAKGDKVIATASATPQFFVPLSGDCRGMTAVIRLSDPIGVVTKPVPASCTGTIAVDVPAQRIVELTATVKSSFDWLEVRLTPVVPDVAPQIVLADAHDASATMESLWSQKITSPSLTVRVLSGTWRINADHEVDAPLGSPPANLTLDAVTSSGRPPVPKFGGFECEVPATTKLELTLRPDHAR